MKKIALIVLACAAGCASPPQRAQRDSVELLAARRGEDTMRELERRALVDRFARRTLRCA